MPISRYSSKIPDRNSFKIIPRYVLQPVVLEDDSTQFVQVLDSTDNSVFGSWSDWSLSAMQKAGINPASFSSPTVNINRLASAEAISSIDLSSLDSNPDSNPNPTK